MAERKISTKFAIEGESEYKAAVKGINQEMKVLSSEMAKTASEFSNAQNSMEALSSKGEVLAKQFETQSQRVETMREALANAQQAQQEWADKQEEAAQRVEELNRQLEELKQAEGDTTEEQARLTEELQQANEAMEYAQRGYEAASKGVEDWQVRLNYAEADLNKLNGKIEENDRLMEEAKNSADGCAQSIDQYGKATKDAGESSGTLGSIGTAAFGKIAGAIGLGGGLLGVATKLVDTVKDLAIEFKNAEVTIVRGTGATGEALRSLMEVYDDVMGQVKSSSEAVSATLAAVNTRLDLTGDELAAATTLIEKFARATNTDMEQAATVVSNLYYTFNRDISQIPEILDMLTVAQQKSNVSALNLGQAVSDNAFFIQAYGLSLKESVAMMAAFEKAGIDSATAARGLKKAYDDVSSSGKTIQQIFKGFRDGTLDQAAAVDLFGNKGANLVTVLKNGNFTLEEMTDSLGAARGKMEETAAAAETFGDMMRGFWNKALHPGDMEFTSSGFVQLQEDARSAAEVLEGTTSPSIDEAITRLYELIDSVDGSAESFMNLTEFLNSNEGALINETGALDGLKQASTEAAFQIMQLDAQVAEAAEGVKSNLDSMMGRFEKVPYTVEQSTVSVIANLQSQLTYMDTYASNMQKAAARGVDEGLLKSLSDGSAESAQILAGLVDATDGEIQTLNDKWNQTQAGKENFSRVMGEIQTDFESRMNSIESSYDAAVQNFNQYAEAQAAGARTIQGAIDGANSMQRPLNSSYYNLGRSAGQQFSAGFNSIPSPQPKRGYASGTLSAVPGWAWTGERGPELILFRGGETVLNHEESMRLAQEALRAQLKAEKNEARDLSTQLIITPTQSAVDLSSVEVLLAGVIDAVQSKEPLQMEAMARGIDRKLAFEKHLINLAGG